MATVQMVCHFNGCVYHFKNGRFTANDLFSAYDKTWFSVITKIHRRHYQNSVCVFYPLAVNTYFLTLITN